MAFIQIAFENILIEMNIINNMFIIVVYSDHFL